MSEIADPSLAPTGETKIAWAADRAPVMATMRDRLRTTGDVEGRRIAVVLPIEPKTALLARILAESGAEVSITSPPSMVHDDVAAALSAGGVEVLARRNMSTDDEQRYHGMLLDRRPEVIVDDRADLITLAHTSRTEALDDLIGATEQTTSGIEVLTRLDAEGTLRVPVIAGNDARCKHLFDNRYGSGQSVIAAVLDRTNLLMAGANVVVVGYGWVGRGVARVAAGMGARVTVTEVDPVAALEAHHDGFEVATVLDACGSAEFVITCSGVHGALSPEAIDRCPDGVVLANAAGIDDEFSVPDLAARASTQRRVRPEVDEYEMPDGRSVFVVGGGHCVNLSAGEGHPVEIMDLSFAVQGLAAAHLARHGGEMTPGLHALPTSIDDQIARDKLAALGISIDGRGRQRET
ncbi:MAG: adenosylhomocysteinase [Acidimicrobiia bacterium]